MGLLSKLLDALAAEKPASAVQRNNPAWPGTPAHTAVKETRSDDRWSDVIPEEENQYNYNGTYYDYFQHVFREEFPSYRLERVLAPDARRACFTFWDEARQALVVEVLFRSCSAYRKRLDCENAGIPYLRFYHDHPGWWNTRSYVTKRVSDALR